jgi:CBS domain-containing protein
MLETLKPLTDLTAEDVMSREVLEIAQKSPLREAVRLLLTHRISGAPVVERGGTCVGVISATDILRWVQDQGAQRSSHNEPHGIFFDWQLVEVEQLPSEDVEQFMTSDPVLVRPDTPITDVARYMVDSHIHRVIVVDRQRRPIGIVSSTDLLACVARAGCA